MDNEKISIENISTDIKKLQYPIIFLFRLISYKDNISDINFSIILKIFLKYHMVIALEYNLKKLFENELVCKKLSRDVLDSFYKIIKRKITVLFLIKKWQNVYPNKIFWNYDYSIQPEKLVHMKNVFNSIYDCSKGGQPLHYKLGNTLNNYDTRENIKERLRDIVILVGKDLLKSLDIILIHSSDFDKLDNKDIIQYLMIIYDRVINILDETIKIFNVYNIYHHKFINLLNPVNITINSITINSKTILDDYIPNSNLDAPL